MQVQERCNAAAAASKGRLCVRVRAVVYVEACSARAHAAAACAAFAALLRASPSVIDTAKHDDHATTCHAIRRSSVACGNEYRDRD